jgi:hypothetical protein
MAARLVTPEAEDQFASLAAQNTEDLDRGYGVPTLRGDVGFLRGLWQVHGNLEHTAGLEN